MNPTPYPPANPQTVAAANALSGERTFMTVQFPCTGDRETDFISGVQASFAACVITHEMAARVLDYLTKRHASEQRAIKEKEAQMVPFSKMGSIGSLIGQGGIPLPPKSQWREALTGEGIIR